MSIKFYASIPTAYLTPDLPPGRYLVSAAGLWDRRKERFRWEKFNPLTLEHEILIDSGGFSFDEYPSGYIEAYKKDAAYSLSVTINERFLQIDRLGDVAFTEANRTPHTIPIIRADAGDIMDQVDKLLEQDFDCDFFAVGGLKRMRPRDAALKIMQAHDLAKACKIKRVHLLGAGLRLMQPLKPYIEAEYPDLEISCDSGSWNCRFGSRINFFNNIMRQNGWTQRETALRHYLPRYREEIEK